MDRLVVLEELMKPQPMGILDGRELLAMKVIQPKNKDIPLSFQATLPGPLRACCHSNWCQRTCAYDSSRIGQ